jgi:Flp pilus assembly protein TadD
MERNVSRLLTLFAFLVLPILPNLAATTATAAPSKAEALNDKKAREISTHLNEKGVELANSGDNLQAEVTLRKAVDADPGNLTAAFNLSGVYIANKKQGAAIKLIEQYVANGAKDAGLFSRLGDAHFSLKEVKKAMQAYEQARAIDPTFSGIAEKLGTIYSLESRLDDAEALMLEAVEQSPKDGRLVSNLSNIFLANGKAEKAISTAKRGLQIKATSELYVTLGSAYEFLKDYKNSLISYKRAADLGDARADLQKKIEQMEKLAS